MTPSEEKQAYEQMVHKVRTPSQFEKDEAKRLQMEFDPGNPEDMAAREMEVNLPPYYMGGT